MLVLHAVAVQSIIKYSDIKQRKSVVDSAEEGGIEGGMMCQRDPEHPFNFSYILFYKSCVLIFNLNPYPRLPPTIAWMKKWHG